MTWRDRLMKEAETIISHGEGRLELWVSPVGADKTKVQVSCGRVWKFEVDRVKDD